MFPLVETPELNTTIPLTPLVPAPGVKITIDPLVRSELYPLINTNRPPDVELVEPADKTNSPPEPLDPVPTATYTEPPRPPKADPDPIYSAPLLPEYVEPELRTRTPLAPDDPALAVMTNISPLLVDEL